MKFYCQSVWCNFLSIDEYPKKIIPKRYKSQINENQLYNEPSNLRLHHINQSELNGYLTIRECDEVRNNSSFVKISRSDHSDKAETNTNQPEPDNRFTSPVVKQHIPKTTLILTIKHNFKKFESFSSGKLNSSTNYINICKPEHQIDQKLGSHKLNVISPENLDRCYSEFLPHLMIDDVDGNGLTGGPSTGFDIEITESGENVVYKNFNGVNRVLYQIRLYNRVSKLEYVFLTPRLFVRELMMVEKVVRQPDTGRIYYYGVL